MTTDGLATRLRRAPILILPGVYDAFSALMAAQAGFEGVYLSGASIAYTRLGRPDVGLVDMGEVAATIALIRDRIALPIVVDGDTGFGNALNVQRTVRAFERAGANAIQLEDQVTPKRCGHLAGKALIGAAEMAGKIRAARDARASDATLIIARTDAIAVEGFDRAIDRAEVYVEAGADVLFVEAPQTEAQLASVGARFGARVPLLANMVEGGRTPMKSAEQLQALGYATVIFPGGAMRAVSRLLVDYYASLKTHGTNLPFRDRMYDLGELNRLIGTPGLMEAGRRYDPDLKDA
jgi:2-methylisocitrate lyase-like PEP mutase family enzyme